MHSIITPLAEQIYYLAFKTEEVESFESRKLFQWVMELQEEIQSDLLA